MTGKLKDGKHATGVLLIKPTDDPTGLNLNLHHSGSVTLVSPDGTHPPQVSHPTDHHQYQEEHNKLNQQFIDEYLSSPTNYKQNQNQPPIPPYTNIPLKDNIPSALINSLKEPLINSFAGGSTHYHNKPEELTALNSYDPPPSGDYSNTEDLNLTPPVDQTDTFKYYSQPEYVDPTKLPTPSNHLTEDESVFQNHNPDGPEPRPSIESLWSKRQELGQLETAQSQLNHQIQTLLQQPEPTQNHLKRSPLVLADPMTYPKHNPAYQLYKEMNHAKKVLVPVGAKRNLKRVKTVRSRRKPISKTYIYSATDRKSI